MPKQKFEVDLTEQKSKTVELQQQMAFHVMNAEPIAEWLFYDCYYNWDGLAFERLDERLVKLSTDFHPDLMFGVMGYLALRGYWKLKEAYRKREIPFRPDLLPGSEDVQEHLASDDWAYVNGVQFVGTITHNNALTSKDLWETAYAKSSAHWLRMAKTIMIVAIRTTNQAEHLGQQSA